MPEDREPRSQVNVIVPAPDDGRGQFGSRAPQQVVGNPFPITNLLGRRVGEGVVVAAELYDGGRALALTIDVPANLAHNLETDAGAPVGEPFVVGRYGHEFRAL